MRNKSRIAGFKARNGFTLIELIVVITVIAILSTIGVVSFVGYSRAQTLNQAAIDLTQTLNTAESLAASQPKTLNMNGITLTQCQNQSLSGYGVQISADQQAYSLYIRCVSNTGIPTSYTDPKLQTNLPKDVSFDSTTNVTDVFFPVLSGGIISDGDSIVLKIYDGINSGYITKKISISQGIISVSQ
jgi:prepilin-type N-terminal cleavage/methylation domain-containing protein